MEQAGELWAELKRRLEEWGRASEDLNREVAGQSSAMTPDHIDFVETLLEEMRAKGSAYRRSISTLEKLQSAIGRFQRDCGRRLEDAARLRQEIHQAVGGGLVRPDRRRKQLQPT